MKVGIIIGRFQVPHLHVGHVDLFKKVIERSDKVVVLLGTAPKSRKNPLNFESRKVMIQNRFYNIDVHDIRDQKHHSVWTKNVDDLVSSLVDDDDQVTLYGGRDSFSEIYKECDGRFDVEELETPKGYSGTKLRKEVGEKIIDSDEFRAGIIAGQFQTYPITFSTVDIIVEKYINNELHILLGQKPIDTLVDKWVFPGGFIDKGDQTGRNAAARELREETSLHISPKMFNIFDQLEIPDYRYVNTENTIFTTVYTVEIKDGWQEYVINNKAEAGDDLCDVKWVKFNEVENHLSSIHNDIWMSYKETKKDVNGLCNKMCSVGLHSNYHLLEPNDLDETKAKCNECGKVFKPIGVVK